MRKTSGDLSGVFFSGMEFQCRTISKQGIKMGHNLLPSIENDTDLDLDVNHMSLQEILELPVLERVQIAQKIWESLSKDEVVINSIQKAELARRIDLDKAGQMEWYTEAELQRRRRD